MNQPLVSGGLNDTAISLPIASRTIGKILLDAGKITSEDVERILRLQKQRGIRFGEAALKLKLVTKEDVQLALATQFEYPYLGKSDSTFSKELIAAYQPFSAKVESLRALRSQLLLRWLDPDRKILIMISPNRGEGRTYVAANLAVVFAQLGENTLLIDADLRAPRQHSIFNLPNRIGLSSLLSGRAGFEVIERIPSLGNLAVLPAGAIPPNPLELLSGAEFSHMLRELSEQFDVIIIDTPAGLPSADAQTVCARGMSLMVIHQDTTLMKQAKNFLDKINATNGEVIGTVLNQF